MTTKTQNPIETGRERIDRIKAKLQSFCPQKACSAEVYEMWDDLPEADQ